MPLNHFSQHHAASPTARRFWTPISNQSHWPSKDMSSPFFSTVRPCDLLGTPVIQLEIIYQTRCYQLAAIQYDMFC